MNIPLTLNIAYTLFVAAITQYIFHSPIASCVVSILSFCILAFFQGASIHNKTIETELDEKL